MKKVIVVFLALFLAGCGSNRVVVKNYYLIEPIMIEQSASDPLSEGRCEISDVDVAAPFASREIAIRDKSHSIKYYENHQWAVQANQAITAVINDNLSARNLFRQVGRRFWDGRPEYSLYTNVHQLEVIIKDKDFYAHLNIEFMLFDNKGDSVAVAHKANRELRLPEKSLNLMAKSISEILAEELNILSSKIEQQLENQ